MAKIDNLKERFKKETITFNIVDIANDLDKSKSKKYIEHLVRFSTNLMKDFELTITNEMEYMRDKMLEFDAMATNGLIEVADLNKYKNIASIKNAIKEASLTKSIGKAKKEIKILYEDDRYMLFLPLSYDAASVYGRGTKWCVTQKEYFYRYSDKGILTYFIDKSINRKIGLFYDMDESYYYNNIKGNKDNAYLSKGLHDDVEIRDDEMINIYRFASKFSCWTDWDVRVEMMFVPIPENIKQLYISYCKENIQNASLFDDVETKIWLNQYTEEQKYLIGEAGVAMDNPTPEMAMEYPPMNETFGA